MTRRIGVFALMMVFAIVGAVTADEIYPPELAYPRATTFIAMALNLQADAPLPGLFDPNNPVETSNFSSSITVYDPLGENHVVTVYFSRTGNGTWDWHALEGNTEAMDSPGTLTFNSVGQFDVGQLAQPVTFSFSAVPINLYFGPHPRNGNVASTQYALPSQVFMQAQDGWPPFYCYSEPCTFNITAPGLQSDGNWWHMEAWQTLSKHTIEWVSLLKSQKFKVFYSTNNGSHWEQIGTDFITGTWPLYSLEWDIPSVTRHKKNCLIKVNAYNANDRKVASIISAYPFRIETLEVTSPEEGTTFVSTEDLTVTWITASSADPVHEVKLYYNRNNSTTWKIIDTIPGNPGTYSWTIPRIKYPWFRAYIKVVLKDDKGNTIGKNVSKHFHVNPPPPTQ